MKVVERQALCVSYPGLRETARVYLAADLPSAEAMAKVDVSAPHNRPQAERVVEDVVAVITEVGSEVEREVSTEVEPFGFSQEITGVRSMAESMHETQEQESRDLQAAELAVEAFVCAAKNFSARRSDTREHLINFAVEHDALKDVSVQVLVAMFGRQYE